MNTVATTGTIALVLAAGACGSTSASNSANSNDEIVLGTTLPLSGPETADGKAVLEGYKLRIAQENAKGGVNGKKIRLIVKDDKFDPARAAQLVRGLIQEDQVQAVLGTFGSAGSLTQSNETSHAGIVAIWPNASTPEMTSRDLPHVYSIYPPSTSEFHSMDEFLKEDVKPKSVAIYYLDNPFAIPGAELAKKELEAAGVQVPVFEKFGSDVQDFTGLLAKAKQANVDVIEDAAYTDQFVTFMQAVEQLDLDPKVVFTLNQYPFDPDVQKLVKDMHLVLGNPIWYPGAGRSFDQAYTQKYGHAPRRQPNAAGYSAADVLIDALEKTGGSTEPTKLDPVLDATDQDEPFPGHVTFDHTGMNSATVEIAQNQDGKKVTVWPDEAAEGQWQPWVPLSKR